MYQYKIKYYGRGCTIYERYVLAKSAQDALAEFRKNNDDVVEIICVVEVQ